MPTTTTGLPGLIRPASPAQMDGRPPRHHDERNGNGGEGRRRCLNGMALRQMLRAVCSLPATITQPSAFLPPSRLPPAPPPASGLLSLPRFDARLPHDIGC